MNLGVSLEGSCSQRQLLLNLGVSLEGSCSQRRLLLNLEVSLALSKRWPLRPAPFHHALTVFQVILSSILFNQDHRCHSLPTAKSIFAYDVIWACLTGQITLIDNKIILLLIMNIYLPLPSYKHKALTLSWINTSTSSSTLQWIHNSIAHSISPCPLVPTHTHTALPPLSPPSCPPPPPPQLTLMVKFNIKQSG